MIRVFVYTSDPYLWCLKPYAYLFNTYWSELQDVIVGGFSHPQFPLPGNFRFHQIDRNPYPKERWSDGLIKFLGDFHDDLIVLMLEDYLLNRTVDCGGVATLADYMRQDKKAKAGQLTFILVRGIGEAFIARGVPDKDVQTDYLSIEPRYKDYNQMDQPIGYVTRNMFVVTLADPAKVESLISRMLEVGVNRVNGVEFQTTEFKQHRESARELALRAAREKAEKMATVLGCTIGKPLAINETHGGGSWYFSSWSGWGYGRSSSGMSQNVIQDTRGSGGEDPQSMALGKISIRVGVSVTFELKDLRSGANKP